MPLSNALPHLLPLAAPLVAAGNFEFPSGASEPVPFNISVNQELIEGAAAKAKLYRPSTDLDDDSNLSWIEGPPQANMTALAKFWAEEYDWSKTQDEINANFSHYAITIPPPDSSEYTEPVPIHFVHERSTNDDAFPLLLLHGWPSTHLEWQQVIGPLTVRSDSGARRFHVVAPDLPGFGFSPAPTKSGLGPRQIGLVFESLMHTLGYSEFGVISTDLGFLVGSWMSGEASNSVVGHFTDFFVVQPNQTDYERQAKNQTTDQENAYMTSLGGWFGSHSAYSTVHTQSPLAVGQAMADSPVGFAGWVWHLMHGVSDGYQYSFNELITSTLMLWIQGPWGNLRSYREFMQPKAAAFPTADTPTGVSQFGLKEGPYPELASFNFAPRDWIERTVNLTYLATHDEGGHFPAKKTPDIWVEDVQEFFAGVLGKE